MQQQDEHGATTPRRFFLQSLLTASASASALVVLPPSAALAAASRAVGSGEIACREAGNCLETGEWDGAIGWEWGGHDRCDAADPLCGPDGKLRDEIVGKQVPRPTGTITHAVAIQLDVGRAETGVLKLGLYGEDCPGAVQQLVTFLTTGLLATDESKTSNSLGQISDPVALAVGGVVASIVPGLTVEFGVPSQAYAYARSRGLSKAGDAFVPQPRPKVDFTSDKVLRSHDVAGLLSVAAKGLGYGGTGFESDDETFERSFLITSDSVPALDKAGRRVVGQVLDATSMAFLERLSSLTTKKGLKGVIPGQTSGPPLLKVTVRDIQVTTVVDGARPSV